MSLALDIFECQPLLFCRPTVDSDDPYTYGGYDKARGLHIFLQSGKREYFSRTRRAPACWHLKRGAYCFEFVTSIAPVQS